MPFDLSSEIDPAKLAALSALYAAGTRPKIQEVVTVYWAGGQTRHYSSTAVDQLSGFTGITAHGITGVQPRFNKMQFLDIARTSDISDDSVSLDFWDGDNQITNLWKVSGEGTKVVVSQYIPDVDLLVESFWGLLKAPDDGSADRFKIKASTGFRSPSLPLPRRWIWVGCAAHFGGAVRPDGTFLFPDAASIADNDCFYDQHIGGSNGLLNGGVPFTTCPRNNPAACIARLGDSLSYLGFDLYLESEQVVTGDHRFTATSRGNEGLQKRPLRVIYGTRVVKDLDLLGYQSQSVGDNPERGYLKTLFLICEGEVSAVYDFYVNDQYVPPQHLWGNTGKKRQAPVLFTTNTLNYSATAVMRADVGPKDWRGITGSQISGQCTVVGKNDIKVYSNPTTFTKQYTTNRAWGLLDVLTNRRYGHQLDSSRVKIQDWTDLAGWCNETVKSRDENDSEVDITRTTFNADLSERSTQQQITDICLAGRLTLPFHFNGKLRILPLRIEDTASAPVFTDQGSSGRNIVFENKQSTLRWWQKSDSEIPNQLKITFDDASRRNHETTFPYDEFDQQMRAGVAAGDRSTRIVQKAYNLLGVTTFAEALRVARMLLYLGEFDQGGIRNNLRCKFTTWSPLVDAMKLHPWKLIKVINTKLNGYAEQPGVFFQYFRIMKMQRKQDLKMEIEAQAYPTLFMSQSDGAFTTGGGSWLPNPGGRRLDNPRPPIVRNPVRTLDYIEVEVAV
ncbi:MAG: hypothetical protein AB7U82_27680 [Blastocatellales bacterium]